MKNNNSLKLAKEWFKKAESDFNYAKAGFKESEFYDTACFLCQQVVEKYLKGFLVANNIRPPKIHILSELLEKCNKIDKNFKIFLKECEILEKYYIPTRYPGGEIFTFTKEQAKEALEIAEKIMKFIKKKLKI